MANITENFKVEGFVEQRKELDRLLMSNPQMEKNVQKLIRKVLMEVRRRMGNAAKASMKSNPRQAYKAVKTAVYRQILGGSVSILNRRKPATKFSAYEPPRKLREGQRGGNRVPRSERTNDLMKYAGADRAFVLRFINNGTDVRTAGTRGGRLGGNRGSIRARNFFGDRSHREMENAAENLTKLIDELIKNELR